MPERVPSVDLPSHARLLALMVDYPEPQRDALGVEANPLAPYWLFHATAIPLTAFVDPYTATRLTLALYLALTPLAFGFWLSARGARPLHGAYSVLVVFGAMPAWGFVGLVAGLPVLAVWLGIAERLATFPRPREAVALALGFLVLYYAHAFVWLAGVVALCFVLVHRDVPRRLLVIPALGALVSAGLLLAYRLTFQSTPYMEALDAQVTSPLEPSLARAASVVTDSAAYGLTDLSAPFAYATWGALVIQLGLSARERDAWTHRELRYGLAAAGALLCCVLASPRAYFLPLRFSVLATVFSIATLPIVSSRASRLALTLGCVFAFASSAVTAVSGYDFSRRTECVATVIDEMRDPGRTLTLVGRSPPEGYAQPVLDHVGLLVAARRGGVPFHETFHTGAHPLRARDPARLPDRDTMLLHALPMLYTPNRARDYDTILTIPIQDPAAMLGDELDAFDAMSCDNVLLLQRAPRPAHDLPPAPVVP
ncbi:MAG: hypothetical protein MUE69_05750 [Myxococcota bacterium]|nr:hypothetical protein [Myxococcota bacterium]